MDPVRRPYPSTDGNPSFREVQFSFDGRWTRTPCDTGPTLWKSYILGVVPNPRAHPTYPLTRDGPRVAPTSFAVSTIIDEHRMRLERRWRHRLAECWSAARTSPTPAPSLQDRTSAAMTSLEKQQRCTIRARQRVLAWIQRRRRHTTSTQYRSRLAPARLPPPRARSPPPPHTLPPPHGVLSELYRFPDGQISRAPYREHGLYSLSPSCRFVFFIPPSGGYLLFNATLLRSIVARRQEECKAIVRLASSRHAREVAVPRRCRFVSVSANGAEPSVQAKHHLFVNDSSSTVVCHQHTRPAIGNPNRLAFSTTELRRLSSRARRRLLPAIAFKMGEIVGDVANKRASQ
ncbi:hypothetical protein C8J57DRAFT_1725141, partial [Mycena rebaudengoi]